MGTLFHYVHCPYCIRVRMILGFLKIEYNSEVLSYDDEKTPVELSGKKMLPIWKDQKVTLNESLDIIKHLDSNEKISNKNEELSEKSLGLEELLKKIGTEVHSLAMPYWIYTPEFNENSREYFQKKKEIKRGPFKLLVENKDQFIENLSPLLIDLNKELRPFYRSEKIGIRDILIASHLWGLYIVPEYQFPEKTHRYLQEIARVCRFSYHSDFWR